MVPSAPGELVTVNVIVSLASYLSRSTCGGKMN